MKNSEISPAIMRGRRGFWEIPRSFPAGLQRSGALEESEAAREEERRNAEESPTVVLFEA
jgi:hypothetical protein